MDRARRWWTQRVWWQKSAVVGLVILVAGLPFIWPMGGAGNADAQSPNVTSTATPTTTSAPATIDPAGSTTSMASPGDSSAPATTTAPSPGPPGGSEGAFIVSIVDGDTVRIQYGSGGTSIRVRLIGIDAPEVDTCFSDEATEALTELLSDFEVYLTTDVSDRDRFDRLLRYLWLEDGTFVNEALVAGGFAIAREFPPDTAHAARLAAAQSVAEFEGAGMWAPGACPQAEAPAQATG